jgi:hypothetical protein
MDIYNKLRELESDNPDYQNYRYFDCDGHPADCDVFLVGINPANGLPFNKQFWNYCNETTGFQLNKWLEEYKEERRNNDRREISPTRNRIETLRRILMPHNLLNCNIYSKNTPCLKDLEEIDKNTDIFKILLTNLQPKYIILHGGLTKKVFERMIPDHSAKVPDWQLHSIILNNYETKILTVPHLFNMALTIKNMDRNIERILK